MDRHTLRRGFAALAVFLIAAPLSAAEQTSTATITAPKPSKFGASLLLQTAGTVNTSNERSSSGLYLATGTYTRPLADGALSASASVGYQRQYTYEGGATQTLFADTMPEGRSGDWIDPRLALMRSHKAVWGFDSVAYGAKATIAGLSFASERKTQAFGLGPSLSLTKTWGRTTSITKVDYRYVHHHYKTRNNGTINSPHVFLLTEIVDYSLGSRSGLALSLGLTEALSYQDVLKGGFGAGLEGYYNLSDKMSASLGVSNESTGYATDGQSRELDLMNPDSATFYFNLEFKI